MPHNGPLPIFSPELPGYCVSRVDEKSSICHHGDHEQKPEYVGKHLRRFRLDGGLRTFWKYCQADATLTSSQSFVYAKNGQRKMGSRIAVRSYPTYTENSIGKSMLEYLRTDSVPVLNFKQSFSTLRRFKRRNLG
uniref:Uncharacterized protein n=1 Tax=Elaeophora elaphi TaxID=1147741 RepID=A0A0R3RLW1_9BILA